MYVSERYFGVVAGSFVLQATRSGREKAGTGATLDKNVNACVIFTTKKLDKERNNVILYGLENSE